MSSRRPLLAFAIVCAPFAVLDGCSLIAKYDSVKPAPGDDASNVGGDTGLGGADSTSETSAPDAPGDHTTSGDVVGDEPQVVLPPVGALVVAGVGAVDGGNAYVLSVLDPTTGNELSREKMPVVGIGYDGETDYWYIFETLAPGSIVASGGPFTAPGDAVVLHVRQLDTHAGKWKEVSAAPIPVPAIAALSPDYIAPLWKRLAYIAWNPQSDARAPTTELVVLDTATPAATTASPADPGVTFTPLPQGIFSMIGTRAVGVAGGVVNFLQSSSAGSTNACSTFSGRCQFQFLPARVATDTVSGKDTVALKSAVAISTFSSTAPLAAGAGSFLNTVGGGPFDVVAIPSVAVDDAGSVITNEAGIAQPGPGTVVQYDPNANAPTSSPSVPFNAAAFRFRPVVFDECLSSAVVGELSGTQLFVLPLVQNATPPPAVDVGHAASNVRFDPYTNSVFVSFNGGGSKSITAYTVSGSAAAPTVSQRTDWNPPSDLNANTMVTRQPTHFTCPADGGGI